MDMRIHGPKVVVIIAALLIPAMFMLGSAQAQVGSGMPDLVIESVQVSPESPAPGETATISVVVTNVGDAEANGPFDLDFHISFGPQELSELGLGFLVGVRIDKKIVTGELRRGESRQIDFSWNVLELPKFTFQFKVDSPINRVFESNENNNEIEHVLAIDESLLGQWWLEHINIDEAWEITTGREAVTVAVIDTGIDISHPEFEGNLWVNPTDGSHGYDFIDNTNGLTRTSPIDFHGTSVAGLIAARQDGDGVSGVAPNVRLMDLRVFPTVGGASFGNIINAVYFALNNGADVINLSLGTNFCSLEQINEQDRNDVRNAINALTTAVQTAIGNGVAVVASAGNTGGCVGYPAQIEGVIAVSSSTIDNTASSFTSFGPEVHIAAPGGSLSREEFFEAFALDFQSLIPVLGSLLVTPYLNSNYGWFTGTSASAPIVSGVVALMISANPSISVNHIRDVLAATAQDLGDSGRDDLFGAGLIDAGAALQCVANHLDCL